MLKAQRQYMKMTHADATVRVLTEAEFVETHDTWIAWTQGYDKKAVAIPKYSQFVKFGTTTSAIRQGNSHYAKCQTISS